MDYYSQQKEITTETLNYMDESHRHYATSESRHKNYTVYDYVYVKFWKIHKAYHCQRLCEGIDCRETQGNFPVMKLFYIFINVVVTQLYTFVKSHHLKLMTLIICCIHFLLLCNKLLHTQWLKNHTKLQFWRS